jgi:peptidoglycan/xylan/chitin deacetylase (PgdA/CDA1 family)
MREGLAVPAKSCILTYHSLDTSGSVISVSPDVFHEQVDWLAANGVPVVPLERIRETPDAVALTFDDGLCSFWEHAAPLLQRYRFPATVFVVSGYCGGWNDWPSQPFRMGIPRLELMGWRELEQIAKLGVTIGCHTVTHPHLSRLSAAEVEEELHRSRSAIEQRLGMAVDTFAYPYGDSTPLVRRVAARHFRLACGTRLAFLSSRSDPLDLPRLDAYYLRGRFWFRGLHKRYGGAYLSARSWLREIGQRVAFQSQ